MKKFHSIIIFMILLFSGVFQVNAGIFDTKEDKAFNYAVKLYEQDHTLALVEFQKFIETYPSSKKVSECYYWIGNCYFHEGEYDSAIFHFKMVAEGYKNFKYMDNIYYNLSKSYFFSKNYARAAESFQEYIKYETDNKTPGKRDYYKISEAFDFIGICYYNIGEYDKSVEYYEKHYEYSGDTKTIFKIFKSYYLSNKYDLALNINGNNNLDSELTHIEKLYYNIYLGHIYFSKDNFDSSLYFFNKVINLTNTDNKEEKAYSLFYLSQIFQKKQTFKKSIEILKTLETLQSEKFSKEIEFNLGLNYFQIGDYNSAIYHTEKNIALYPDFRKFDSIKILIESYYKLKKFTELISIYENYIITDNIDRNLYLEKIADAYLNLNKNQKVLEILSSLRPTKSEFYYNLKYIECSALYNLKEYHKSITETKLLLAVKDLPEDIVNKCNFLLGNCYFETGEFKTAQKLFFDLSLKETFNLKSKVVAKLGLCNISLRDLKMANAVAEVALEKYPDDYDIQYFIFNYLNQIKDIELKKKYFDRIIGFIKDPELKDKFIYLLSNVLLEKNQNSEAIEFLNKIKSPEFETRKKYSMALAKFNLKDYKSSIAFLNNCVIDKETSDNINYLYAQNYFFIKDYVKSLEHSQKLSGAINLKYYYIGMNLYNLKKYNESSDALNKFISTTKDRNLKEESLYYLSVIKYLNGEFTDSLNFLNQIRTDLTSKFEIDKIYSLNYITQNNLSKALQHISAYEKNFFSKLNDIEKDELHYIKSKIFFGLKNFNNSIASIIQIKNPLKLNDVSGYFKLAADNYQSIFDYENSTDNYLKFIKYAENKNEYDKTVKRDVSLKIINNYFKMEKYDKVISLADAIIKDYNLSDDMLIESVLLKAKSLFYLQKYDEMISYLENNKINNDNYNIEKYFRIAGAYYNLKKYRQSIENYLVVSEKYPDNVYALDIQKALIRNYKLSGDLENFEKLQIQLADSEYDDSIKLEAAEELGIHYFDKQLYDSAVLYLTRVIDESNEPLKIEKACRYTVKSQFILKNHTAVIKLSEYYFNKLTPDTGYANDMRLLNAESYYMIGDMNNAVINYKKIYPSTDYVEFRIAAIYFNSADYENCILNCHSFLNIPEYSKSKYYNEIKFLLAYSYSKNNNSDSAILIFNDIYDNISSNQNKIIAADIVINSYFKNENDTLAAEWMDKRIKIEDNLDYKSRLSEYYFKTHQFQKSEKLYYEILNSNSSDILKKNAAARLYEIFTLTNRHDKALEILNKTENKNDIGFILKQTEALMKTGMDSEAHKNAVQYIASIKEIKDTDQAKIFEYSIALSKKLSKPDDYYNYIESSLARISFSNSKLTAGFMIELADDFFNSKNYPSALTYYWKVILTINEPSFYEYCYYRIIKTYCVMPDVKKAVFQFNKFKSIYPESKYLKELNDIKELKNEN